MTSIDTPQSAAAERPAPPIWARIWAALVDHFTPYQDEGVCMWCDGDDEVSNGVCRHCEMKMW